MGVLFEISIVCLFFVPFLFCFWFLACLVSFGWLWCLLAVLVGGCCGWLRGVGWVFDCWVWIGFLGYWNGLRADLRWLFWLFGLVCGLFFGFFGEFDPGSGRTLAACLTYASRTGLVPFFLGVGLVANG